MNVVVAGGGASGLAAAIAALRKGHSVKVLELKSEVGKKLLVTGNGRCNLTNLNLATDFYNQTALVKEVIAEITPQVLLSFFESIGLRCTSDVEGRVYPYTFSAADVRKCLTNEILRLGGELVTNCKVEKIDAAETCVKVFSGAGTFCADRLVLCSGGLAGTKDNTSFSLVDEKFLVPIRAALAPLKTIPAFKQIDGLRVKCVAELLRNNSVLASEKGEVLFRSYGLSGIAIFNLSSCLQREKFAQKCSYTIKLDFFPDMTVEVLTKELAGRVNKWQDLDSVFCGLLNEKLAKIVCKNFQMENLSQLANALKSFTMQAIPPTDFASAQITCGGIDTKFINGKMQFLPLLNTSVCGEIVDVDGLCGGYNLHWAFASGLVAGRNL